MFSEHKFKGWNVTKYVNVLPALTATCWLTVLAHGAMSTGTLGMAYAIWLPHSQMGWHKHSFSNIPSLTATDNLLNRLIATVSWYVCLRFYRRPCWWKACPWWPTFQNKQYCCWWSIYWASCWHHQVCDVLRVSMWNYKISCFVWK